MSKVNAVWNKAKKVLEGKKLAELHADLVIQDKNEKELKKRLFEGTDSDGLFEAGVRQEFVDILQRYGLSEYFPGEKYSARTNDPSKKSRTYPLKNEKLLKILKNARKSGFTDAELQLLKEEMGHYQMKIDEYESLKMEYETLEEQVDNSLDNLEQQGNIWKELAQKKKDMKDRHKEFREGLKRLEGKVGDKVGDKDNSFAEFEDSRVYQLWALAQKAGFEEDELESVKKELTHFENRIKKAEFVQSQVNRVAEKKDAGGEVDLQEYEQLQDRAKHFHKKVDKYHKDISERIHRKLDEL